MSFFTKRYHPPGTSPGTLSQPETPRAPLQLSILDYTAERLEETHGLSAQDCKPYLASDTITWIHVQGYAEPDVLRELGVYFDLHPLALEDVLNTGQRPKMEMYEDQAFVILSFPVVSGENLRTEQVSLFAGDNYVVSIHDGEQDPFEPVRKRLRNAVSRLRQRRGDYLLYALVDTVIDQGFPVLEYFGEHIEDVEDLLLDSPSKEILPDMHAVKRDMLFLRRMLWPQREVINDLMREPHPFIREETKLYLRDCYDHTIQIMDLVETYRDMTAGMLDMYLSSVSYRLNEVMRVLTLIATLFIPPTFLVGVYGMNFDRHAGPWSMPELDSAYGYPLVWLVILTMMGGMVWLFKRRKWL